MPDLEKQITAWRQQMLAAGIKTPALLDELQSHLREDIERQMQSGAEAQQAFETAVQRLGQACVLKAEFAKGDKEARQGKVIGIACCTFAGLFSLLLTPRLLTIHEMSMAERMWGLAAVALTVLSMVSFRFSHKYLPVIRNRRVRMAVGVGCGLTGAGWLLVFVYLLPDVIVPHILAGANGAALADSVRGRVIIGLKDIPPAGDEPVFLIAISILWAMALMAVLGGIAYGLEEAARRRTLTADS
jgi:hypothetical protein